MHTQEWNRCSGSLLAAVEAVLLWLLLEPTIACELMQVRVPCHHSKLKRRRWKLFPGSLPRHGLLKGTGIVEQSRLPVMSRTSSL